MARLKVRLFVANRPVLCLDDAPHVPRSVWVATDPAGSFLMSAPGRIGLDGLEDCDQEVGVFTPRTKVPRG